MATGSKYGPVLVVHLLLEVLTNAMETQQTKGFAQWNALVRPSKRLFDYFLFFPRDHQHN